jgi:hypothetical protein
MMLTPTSPPHPEIILEEADLQFELFPFEPGQGEEKITTGHSLANAPTQPSVAAMKAVNQGGGSDG